VYGALEISTSGMIAQRTRLEAYTANIANAATFTDALGRNIPYARREVYFAPGGGRRVPRRKAAGHWAFVSPRSGRTTHSSRATSRPIRSRMRRGYVKYPNINTVFEQMNAYDAMRAYEANLAAAEATKAMMAQALRLIA